MNALPDMRELFSDIGDMRSPARHGELALRVADLLEAGSDRFSAEHFALFDTVLMRLVDQIETAALVELSTRLGPLAKAPVLVIEHLSRNASIDIAAPILRLSPLLAEGLLVERAAAGSEAHLLAISERVQVTEPVTDILVDRGGAPVLRRIAANKGARFSTSGMSQLVGRARDDDMLALAVGARTDVSPHEFLKLVASASALVRGKLEAASPHAAADIRRVVGNVTDRIARQAADAPRDYSQALADVRALHKARQLRDPQVRQFAERGAFEMVVAAFMVMADLPVIAAENAMKQERPESVLIIARAVGLHWETTRSILRLKAGPKGATSHMLEQAAFSFERLKPETAMQALHFQRAKFANA